MLHRFMPSSIRQTFFSKRSLFILLTPLWLQACAPVSYLENHRPSDLVFRKQAYGGVAALVGTELSAPGFSLYADGTVIYYQYINGKRKLVFSRLSKDEFFEKYNWIRKNLTRPFENIPRQAGAPVTEFIFNSQIITVEGLGFIRDIPVLDTLQAFSAALDQWTFKNKKYTAQQIVLYVKKLSGGDPKAWPEWKVEEVRLDSIYKKDIGFYEPNTDENSILLEGKTAKSVQDRIEQTSIYQKFSSNGKIYAVGYRPVLP